MPESPSLPKQVEQLDPELQKKKQELRDQIHSLRPIFDTLAKQGVGVDVVEKGPEQSLYFDSKTGRCVLNLDFFLEHEFTWQETLFGGAHEVEHLVQATEDPQGFMRLLDEPKRRAKEKSGGDEVKEQILEKIYFQFMNVFLDVNVNNRVRRSLLPFQKGRSQGEVMPELYRRKLFRSQEEGSVPDYSAHPRYVQFLQALLREYMVPDEKVQLSDEVRALLEQKFPYFGQQLTVAEFTEQYLVPHTTTAGELLFHLNHFLMPLFEDLLAKDDAEGNLKAVKIIEVIDGEPDATSKHWRKAAEKIDADRKAKERSAKERQDDLAKEQFQEWAKGKGFTEREIERLEQIRELTEEEVERLKELWHLFMGIATMLRLEKTPGHKWGVSVNVGDVVRQWPRITQTPESARVMEQYVLTAKEELVPKEIKMVLIIDLSSSMDEEKRRAVQEAVYSIVNSLIRFRNELRLQLPEDADEIAVTYRLLGFGSSTIVLPKNPQEDELYNVHRAAIDIWRVDLGGTVDSAPLQMAADSFSPDDKELIERGELLGVVIEITDGETETESASSDLVVRINGAKVFCKGIQIPGSVYDETPPPLPKEREEPRPFEPPKVIPTTGAFARVWKEHGQRLDHLSQLREILSHLLRQAIEARRQ